MDANTKVHRLCKLPLWQCDECQRLEFSEPRAGNWGPLCPNCDKEMTERDKESNTVFEAIGQHFQRDTGMLRPGKDCAILSREYRANAFDAWNWNRD